MILIVALIAVIIALLAGFAFTMSNPQKHDTNLTFKSKSTITQGESLKIKLTDVNGTPIANQTVNVTITGKDKTSDYHSVVTNKKGTASLKLHNDPGKYKVKLSYDGNDNYSACNATKKIKIEEEAVEPEPVAEQSSQAADTTSASYSDGSSDYYNGLSRNDFSEGEQAAIDDARANGYDSPAAYYEATGKTAGQDYIDAHPELAGPRV